MSDDTSEKLGYFSAILFFFAEHNLVTTSTKIHEQLRIVMALDYARFVIENNSKFANFYS